MDGQDSRTIGRIDTKLSGQTDGQAPLKRREEICKIWTKINCEPVTKKRKKKEKEKKEGEAKGKSV